jgi:hypothetical protein
MRYAILCLGLLLLPACGGSVATIGGAGGTGDGGGTSDASVTSDGSSGKDGNSTSDGTIGDDATSSESSTTCTVTRVPMNHRATDVSCPTARGPGVTTTGGPDGGGPPGQCDDDSDCTMGHDGRCLPIGPLPGNECSYDQCYDDSACTGNVPCVCRPSAASNDPNVCGTGSNCRLDSDCGPCGFCSPSESEMTVCGEPDTTYFCHTPSDLCVDDSDCHEGSCNWVPAKGYWQCGRECAPPPP